VAGDPGILLKPLMSGAFRSPMRWPAQQGRADAEPTWPVDEGHASV